MNARIDVKLFTRLLEIGFDLRWDKFYAKWSLFRYQSLLYHSLNVALVANEIASFLGVDKRWRRALIVGAFFHDFAKGSKQIQEYVRKHLKSKTVPKATPEAVKEVSKYIERLGLDPDEVKVALSLAFLGELPRSVDDLCTQLEIPSVPQKLLDIVSIADGVVSIRNLDDVESLNKKLRAYGAQLTYHCVSAIRGISTQLLHQVLEDIFRENGAYPIARTHYATIYITKCDFNVPELSKEEIIERLLKKFLELLNLLGPHKVASAIYGKINETVIKSPRLLLIENVIDEFWKCIVKDLMKCKATSRFYQKVRDSGICEKLGIYDENCCKEIADRLRRIHYMLVVFKSIGSELDALYNKSVAKGRFSPSQRMWEVFAKEFNLCMEDIEAKELNQMVLQKSVDVVIDSIGWFAEKVKLFEKDIEETMNELAKKFSSITKIVVSEMKENNDILMAAFREPLLDLCSDIAYPVIVDLFEEANEVYDKYFKSKARITPLCSICGKPASLAAQSSKVGEGTQSFTNFLEAGVNIDKRNKAWICSVCDFEAELRSLCGASPDQYSVFYIIPMLTAGREFNEALWRYVKKAIDVAYFFSDTDVRRLIDHTWWAGKIVEEGLNWLEALIPKVIENIFTIACEIRGGEESIIKKLTDYLRENYEGSLELAKIVFTNCRDAKSFKELAKCIYESGKLPEGFQFKEVFSRIASYAGNYLVVFIEKKLGYKEESESVEYLRKIFVGLLLAKLFQSSVYIPEIEMEALFHIAPRGYVKYIYKTTLKRTFDLLGIESQDKLGNWIPIHVIDDVLVKLAALIVIDEKMRRNNTNYGSNSLLELSSKPPGRILSRYLSGFEAPFSKAKEIYELIRLLDLAFYNGKGGENIAQAICENV